MLNFGASKPRVKGGAQAPGAPLDPSLRIVHVNFWPHSNRFDDILKRNPNENIKAKPATQLTPGTYFVVL